MTLEIGALAASAVFAGLWSGLLGMLTLVMHKMLATMDGASFETFLRGFLPVGRKAWFNYVCALGMAVAPIVALVALWDDRSQPAFALTAAGLALVIVGVYVVSNVWKEPLYDVMLAWDPAAMPAEWKAGRQRYFAINWIQAATTWTVFGLFLTALIIVARDEGHRGEADHLAAVIVPGVPTLHLVTGVVAAVTLLQVAALAQRGYQWWRGEPLRDDGHAATVMVLDVAWGLALLVAVPTVLHPLAVLLVHAPDLGWSLVLAVASTAMHLTAVMIDSSPRRSPWQGPVGTGLESVSPTSSPSPTAPCASGTTSGTRYP